MTEFVAEMVGTFFLVLLGNGVVANVVLTGTKGENSGWIVITTGWALAVFVGVVIAAPFSGAHLNPAVTLALAIAQKLSWLKVPLFISAQFIGAMLASLLVYALYRDHLSKTDNAGLKAACFFTSPAIRNKTSNLLSETVGTFVLIFVIFYFTNAEMGNEKTPVGLGSLGAIPVAFLVWSIGLSLGGTTGYAINPARDLGPRIIHHFLPIKGKAGSDWSYAWIPVAGPVIGSVLAASFYLILKYLLIL
ncbi:MAG: MIP/aquaporin family protein [Daejeonella sp.]